MFTGIVEDLGVIRRKDAAKLQVLTKLDGINIGDSVAVNGICLTATSIVPEKEANLLSFDFSPETGLRTSLEKLSGGDQVNLERALRVGDRLGGHFLSGHIDGTGRLVNSERQGEFFMMSFSCDKGLSKYVVEKGSIGVDGISLTVARCAPGGFTVAVIPHTVENTNLHLAKAGATVNLEADILAKYIENLLAAREGVSKITPEFLRQNGF